MEIVIDFSQFGSNPLANIWWFFRTIGWIYPVFLFAWGLIKFWQAHIRKEYRKKRKYILLAIDIPKNNEQTPKAVENIFNHLAGAHKPLRRIDKWWYGELPESFSLEIVSIGGYIQFIIHLEQQFRDLVEAMIYAQYPDAEITEVEDYTNDYKDVKFPNEKYDLWGAEVVLAKKQYYPIRTYREFEDTASKETYKDSMAALLEALTRVGPGEQIWVHFIVTPADNDWGDGAKGLINKLIGAKAEKPKGLIASINNFFGFIIDQIITPPESKESKSDPNQLLYLTSGAKDVVEAVEKKITKIGFHTTIHVIYLAEKDKFLKPKGVNVYSTFKQFNTNNLNAFKPNGKTYTGGLVYFKKTRLNYRKTNLLKHYRDRGHWFEPGTYGKILNTEELATVYHFPILTVKAPLLQKTEIKKGEPPISLPVEHNMIQPVSQGNQSEAAASTPPENLPI